MWSKKTSGVIGMVIGMVWFLANIRYVGEQGFVAIAMPIVIFILGVIYFRKGNDETQ